MNTKGDNNYYTNTEKAITMIMKMGKVMTMIKNIRGNNNDDLQDH
jgi:hypothetical protein